MSKKVYGNVKLFFFPFIIFILGVISTIGLNDVLNPIAWFAIAWFFCLSLLSLYWCFTPIFEYGEQGFISRNRQFEWNQLQSITYSVLWNGFYINYIGQ